MRLGFIRIAVALTALSMGSPADAQGLPDFGALSLEQLSNVKVTSFTNKEQMLSQVAGAVYIINREQIERSGLTSVPELLRLAPGVDVARVKGNQWSVSVRGPVGAYSNKLLVLIDGRSIYSPIFSGVYWEIGMPPVEDIERIEVIRGPGATIWGANAVLGVINIITRSSRDTHGTTVRAAAGTSEHPIGSVTTGGTIGSASYRVYAGGSDEAPLSTASGTNANDALTNTQAGFRMDGSNVKNTWMLEGNVFHALEDDTTLYYQPTTQSNVETTTQAGSLAGSLTGEWRRHTGENGEFRIRSYYDSVSRPEPQVSRLSTRSFDTELEYDLKAGRSNNISLGGGNRLISEKVGEGPDVAISPAALTYVNVNVFAQDEIHLAHDTVLVTFGAKLERDHFGGWGPEPSANVLWSPSKRHSFWASTARPLRTPSLADTGLSGDFLAVAPSSATGGLPIIATLVSFPRYRSESVQDFETGYRGQLTRKLSLDLTVFYDLYSKLPSSAYGDPVLVPAPLPYLNVTINTSNGAKATGKGAEGSIAWQALSHWKLEGSYTYNAVNSYLGASAPPGSSPGSSIDSLNPPARTKWKLQSYANLARSWKLDTMLYWTSAGTPGSYNGTDLPVPSYTRLDLRLAYKASAHWEFSIAGQNLLQDRHLEAVPDDLSAPSYVKRGAYLKSTWKY